MTEYYLPDIPRLYTALAEWMACLIFISHSQIHAQASNEGLAC